MAVRTCSVCGIAKSEDEFPSRDGKIQGRCRLCKAYREREWRRKLSPENQARRREQIRKAQAKYYARNGNSVHQAKAVLAYRLRWPKKRAAWMAATSALKSGRIKAPACCQHCGMPEDNLQMHHPDYDQPLMVEFLCPECHGKTRRID